MSAATFLSQMRRLNVQIRIDGDELKCIAQPGVLTPELREQLRRLKPDILEFLGSTQTLATQQRAIVPLQQNGQRIPIFAVPGHNGDVFCFRALAQALGDEQPFFGLQPQGVDGQSAPSSSVAELATDFATQIRAFRPQGPYIIAGFCAGGTVAFELAQRLSRDGALIPFVALFGSPYPTFFRRSAQLRRYLAEQIAALADHARELATCSLTDAGRYLLAKLQQRKARREAEHGAALDPVLVLRAKVERATLAAVRSYAPRRFAGRLNVFLPSRQWARANTSPELWCAMAERSAVYFGAPGCTVDNMLREPNAPAFAELLRRACADYV